MALTQATNIGSPPAVLRFFRWTKPGVMEAVVEQAGVARSQTATPVMPKLPYAMRLESYKEEWTDGVGKKTWVYRAGKTISHSPTDTNVDPDQVWSADVSLSERPISSHPKLDDIRAKYGGVLKDGRVEFPQKMSDGTMNPMYMVDTYLAPSVNVSLEKVDSNTRVSTSSLSDLGYIDDPSTSGSPFSFCSGLNEWLLVGHEIRRQGDETSERKSWKWGGPGGWVQQVYKKGYF
jgi:hypothetical protein